MAKRKRLYVDEKLDNQLENFMQIGDFNSKAEASETMAEIFEEGLRGMASSIENELKIEVQDPKVEDNYDEDGFFDDPGIEHDLLL